MCFASRECRCSQLASLSSSQPPGFSRPATARAPGAAWRLVERVVHQRGVRRVSGGKSSMSATLNRAAEPHRCAPASELDVRRHEVVAEHAIPGLGDEQRCPSRAAADVDDRRVRRQLDRLEHVLDRRPLDEVGRAPPERLRRLVGHELRRAALDLRALVRVLCHAPTLSGLCGFPGLNVAATYALRAPTGRHHLHPELTPARLTEAWRVGGPLATLALVVVALRGGPPATGAVRHRVLESSLIGISSSDRSFRSWSAGRPSVVR